MAMESRTKASSIRSYGALLVFLLTIHVTIAEESYCFDVDTNPSTAKLARKNSCGVSKALDHGVTERVMGGINAHLGEFPWMARLFYRSKNETQPRCGGSIIHEQFVLTAAHCCKGDLHSELLFVRLGEYDSLTDPDCHRGRCAPKHKDIGVERIFSHEEYDSHEMINDICLLKLNTKVKFSDYIYPVCLPVDCKMQKNKHEHTKLMAAGWGLKDEVYEREIDILQTIKLTAVPKKTCEKIWSKEEGAPFELKDTQFCAGGEVGRDVCGGDSGGPLMFKSTVTGRARQYVVGLVSYGSPCSHRAKKISPGVYTNVASYLPWIFTNLKYN